MRKAICDGLFPGNEYNSDISSGCKEAISGNFNGRIAILGQIGRVDKVREMKRRQVVPRPPSPRRPLRLVCDNRWITPHRPTDHRADQRRPHRAQQERLSAPQPTPSERSAMPATCWLPMLANTTS